MGRTRLPAHIRRLLPPEHREPRKRAPRATAERDFLRQHGADSLLELVLLNRLQHAGLPTGEAQYRFVEGRQFRFDRAWPERRVAVEVQGGVWSDDGHGRKSMVARDCAKLSMGAAMGWRVLPLTKEMIESGQAVELIHQALGVGTR
jgi:hypothetical protein